jgi:hypothetical protein
MGARLGLGLGVTLNAGGGVRAGYGVLKINGQTLRISGQRIIIPLGA